MRSKDVPEINRGQNPALAQKGCALIVTAIRLRKAKSICARDSIPEKLRLMEHAPLPWIDYYSLEWNSEAFV